MNILVKFPSRERPHKFFLCIRGYIDNSNGVNVRYLITLDQNDPTLDTYIGYCQKLKAQGVNIEWIVGVSESKIHAINRDMEKSGEWDILVLASDDMICKVQNWDVILENEMWEFFEDTDGTLFHWDGDPATTRHDNGKGLCTMCILGRKYCEKVSYEIYKLNQLVIYHPEYISLWCDNEYSEVARMLGKEAKFEQVLFKHEHYSNDSRIPKDALMTRTQSFYSQDEKTYHKRKALNFGL